MNRVYVNSIGMVTPKGHSIMEIVNSLIFEKKMTSSEENYLIKDYSLEYKNLNFCANLGVNAADQVMIKHEINRDTQRNNFGTFVGTAYGGFTDTQYHQTSALINEGPLGVSPGLSIHSGFHLTGDIIAIKNKFEGPNITFTSGENSSGLAFMEAFDQIKYQNLEGAIVVGTEFIDKFISEGYKLINNQNVEILSSGAGSVFLSNQQNNLFNIEVVTIQFVSNFGKIGSYSSQTYKSISSAILKALKDSNINKQDIDIVISMLGPTPTEEIHFLKGMKMSLGKEFKKPVIYPKKILGDMLGANFIIGAIIGAEVLLSNKVMLAEIGDLKNVLIVSSDSFGNVVCTILQKGAEK
ncbi:hypothetical protein LCM23_21450 [Cytobacillus kochii]|uniref:beta-ketoacyl synthase N-terminal-like domain-containing protein n=1 Tax=Cytobacillus kochii TaxID=859143 RepID=UPI001CD59DAD|nr:beta-ketoacyl synthase N-terminal-like domain-containing protein [Cytobacillus kochii]MCA1028639.1 hypothetical protein [Cytobacillus kochii]